MRVIKIIGLLEVFRVTLWLIVVIKIIGRVGY